MNTVAFQVVTAVGTPGVALVCPHQRFHRLDVEVRAAISINNNRSLGGLALPTQRSAFELDATHGLAQTPYLS